MVDNTPTPEPGSVPSRLLELRQQAFGAIIDVGQSKPAARKLLEAITKEISHAVLIMESQAAELTRLRGVEERAKKLLLTFHIMPPDQDDNQLATVRYILEGEGAQT